MAVCCGEAALAGITYSKQFPNPAEPLRGVFVAEQVRATAESVSWSVIAPAPRTFRLLARVLPRPYVEPHSTLDGRDVFHPSYVVLPRRLCYARVGRSMARASERVFERIVRDQRPSFMHVHTLYPAGAAGRLLARRHGLPYVVTIHGSDLYTNITRESWEAEVLPVVRDATAVICVSERLAIDAIERAGADPARTIVIPNTFDASTFALRDEPPSGETLLSVGRLVDIKGHDVLLEAVAALAQTHPRLRLRIVGAGPERSALESCARELGIADRVTFLGALGSEQLSVEYRSADLFVLPSLREGFGVVLLESLASGTPVVATRSGGPESIVDASLGELAEPGDATSLAEAIERALGRLDGFEPAVLSRTMHDRYHPDVVGERLVRLYREVVAGTPPSESLGATFGEDATREVLDA